MARGKAEKQKQKAKELLGIDDERAKEIFKEQPDRKQQKKKELEGDAEEEAGGEDDAAGDQEEHVCEECGQSFDSERGLKSHASQVH
ncbi:MAG: hypothetical protein ABEJ98_05565 [Candidatus Nanohaloarchaea archaeon]